MLAAIVIAAAFSSSMNAYSGSLALQSLNIRIRRPAIAVISVLLGFGLTSWIHSGNLDTRFANILLFTGYWLSPFVAIVMIDWHFNSTRYTPAFLRTTMAWHNLWSHSPVPETVLAAPAAAGEALVTARQGRPTT